MIAYGCPVTQPPTYRRFAQPGIALAAEPDSVILVNAAAGTIYRSFNLVLDAVGDRDDLEALVLLHQDAEITDPAFAAKVRSVLADPQVAVLGAVGATGVRSLAWWEGDVTWASFLRAYGLAPDGALRPLPWDPAVPLRDPVAMEVELLDGFVLVLSPWAVRHLRFDEGLRLLVDGFDLDICFQAREAGRTVVAHDLRVRHHHGVEFVTDPEQWTLAHQRLAEKWEGRLLDATGAGDWRGRARRAEAEAGIARLAGASKLMQAYAVADEDEVELKRMQATRSWRMTEPLRWANGRRRARRARASA